MQDFKKLEVWKRAYDLSLVLYRETAGFPKSELFGLTSQIRRAAVSIGANIAEGSMRPQMDFARMLQIALGSVAELEHHLMLARDLGYTSNQDSIEEVNQIRRMLYSLWEKVHSPET